MNKFLLSWDCYGLESCQDVTELHTLAEQQEKESLFERLRNPDEEPANEHTRKFCNMVQMLSLRARFNPQRNYEVYYITADASVQKEDIVQWFQDTPQQAAERCRAIGVKLLSHRETAPERRVIS